MLNASPLNAVPLNGLAGATADPEYIVRGQSFLWTLRLMVGGLNLTPMLTGTVTVDREEGAAGIAGCDLFIAPGVAVVPPDWKGRAVSIDYISTSQGETIEARKFTGQISRADWNPVNRILTCECSDQLQQRVEGMTIAAIDALVGGRWSEDLFEPVEGRSHWDYARERMSTRTASLDCSAYGDLRVTSWYATAPHFVFGPGTTLYQQIDLQQSDLEATTNRVEIEFSYRYPRLWQLNEGYSWTHVNAGGGQSGFCNWRVWATELPDTDMIASAVSGSGQQLLGGVGGYKLPLSMANPCGDGQGWVNTFDNLWLSASFTGARRWVQSVTESYKLVLSTAAGESELTRIVQRAGYTVSIERDQAESWGSDPIRGGGTGSQDLSDEGRRSNAIATALRIGQAMIVGAHRETTLSWDVPTSMAMGIDLWHTLEIADQGVHAVGKCRRIVHRFDLGSGEAITSLSIAIMRGGGVSDALAVPPQPDTSLPPFTSSAQLLLGTQLGGRQVDPYTGFPIGPYDDDRPGFSGNYDTNDNMPAEFYPRRFDINAREIGAEYRDERTASAEAFYRIGIPNDLLEL
ncbi:hypothetical protein [Stutzerimonas stutzeri]|uniref:hypothetical protein n=1 Tax=Stutzerimonas stutzeri TaxID=316 RepID=UPI00244B68BE|nr:hypothetical protein [Stutzerimonas stutzeri]MDH0082754.1 hypothetical protein [Stutzerimonas stutzeri]